MHPDETRKLARPTGVDLNIAFSLAILAVASSSAGLLSCSATSGGLDVLSGSSGGQGGTSSQSAGGQGGGGQSERDDGPGIDISGSGSGSGGSGGGGIGAGCATSSTEAVLLPLNMFVAIDKSSSMASGTKWKSARAAFTQFFQDPAAASLRVALRFWPDDQPASSPSSILCNAEVDQSCGSDVVAACQQPEVDIGPLADPTQQQALTDAFQTHQPDGDTPTWAALKGATHWCANYILHTNRTERAVVVLVTDGEPTSCDTDPTSIAKLADLAYQGAGVLTFAVGLAGANKASMDTIAKGGHTGQSFMIGSGDVAGELLTALKKIQGSSVACSFKVPDAPPGEMLDLDRVNVEYTAGSAVAPSMLGMVPTYGSCGQKGGWYYDDPHRPTSINLCPASCAAVRSNNGSRINIVLGCFTQPA